MKCAAFIAFLALASGTAWALRPSLDCDVRPGLAMRWEIKTPAEIAELAEITGKPVNTVALSLFPGTEQCQIWMPPQGRWSLREYGEIMLHEACHCQEGRWHE